MRHTLLILVLGLTLGPGCDTGNSEIREAEKQFQTDPTGETYTKLMNIYNETIATLPAGEKRTEILEKAFEASKQQKSSINTMQYAKHLLEENPDHPDRAEWLLALGDTYQSLNRSYVLDIFRLGFAQQYPDHERSEELLNAVKSDERNIDTLIHQLAEHMFNDSLFRLETTLAYNYIDACELYSYLNPEEDKSAEYLHKAAETLRSLQSIPQSLDMYDRIITEFPDHPRAVQSLFLKAFTYDNNLQEFDSARKYYTMFLEKYPDDEFANSAQFLLDNLGKSDEELLDVLQKKSGEQQESEVSEE